MRAVIEMPMYSEFKYELDKSTGRFFIDRQLPVLCPYNYGFIEGTIAPDGDPVDCFILSDYPLPQDTHLEYEVLGMFQCDDNGDQDDKVVLKIKGTDSNFEGFQGNIKEYLSTYKKGFKVGEWVHADRAKQLIEASKTTPTNWPSLSYF